MQLRPARAEEFSEIRIFYWKLIDILNTQGETIGWKKGIYPSDEYIENALANGELYVIDGNGEYDASVIINSSCNEGYTGCPWSVECAEDEVIIPHALAVNPAIRGRGVGETVVRDITEIARQTGKKTLRLDILNGNIAAQKLYTKTGFRFVQSKKMFYEDTGFTKYDLYELAL